MFLFVMDERMESRLADQHVDRTLIFQNPPVKDVSWQSGSCLIDFDPVEFWCFKWNNELSLLTDLQISSAHGFWFVSWGNGAQVPSAGCLQGCRWDVLDPKHIKEDRSGRGWMRAFFGKDYGRQVCNGLSEFARFVPWSTYSVCTHFIKPFWFEDCLCGGCQASHFRQIYLQISLALFGICIFKIHSGRQFSFLAKYLRIFRRHWWLGPHMVLSQVDHLLDSTGLMCAHINTSVENAEVLFDVTPTNSGSTFLCRNRCKSFSWSRRLWWMQLILL